MTTAPAAAKAVLAGSLPDYSGVTDSGTAAAKLTEALGLAHDLIQRSGLSVHPADVVRLLGGPHSYGELEAAAASPSWVPQAQAYARMFARHFAEENIAENTVTLNWLNGTGEYAAVLNSGTPLHYGVAVRYLDGEFLSSVAGRRPTRDPEWEEFSWDGPFDESVFIDLIVPLALVSARVVDLSRRFRWVDDVYLDEDWSSLDEI